MLNFYENRQTSANFSKQSGIYSKRVNSGEIMRNYSTPFAKELRESKGVLSDAIAKDFNFLAKDKSDEYTVPHPYKYEILRKVYRQVPIVANSINNTANFALQAGYEIDASASTEKKILDFFKKFNIDNLLLKTMKEAPMLGTSYWELGGESTVNAVKMLPVETMYATIFRGAPNDGAIKSYKQIIGQLGTKDPIVFEKDKIIQFKWNDVSAIDYYGMSDIIPVYWSISKFVNWQEDLGKILHRMASPIIHWRIGTEEQPGTQDQVDDFLSTLQNRETGEDIVTSSNVESDVVAATARMLQVDGLVRNLENQIIAGLQVPATFVRGGETSNKATADVELQAFDRKVKALQQSISMMLEDFLFPKISSGEAYMVWNELSAEGELSRAQRFNYLVSSQIPPALALKVVGWGSWSDDFEKAQKEQEAKMLKNPELNPNQAKTNPAQKKQTTQDEEIDQYAEVIQSRKYRK